MKLRWYWCCCCLTWRNCYLLWSCSGLRCWRLDCWWTSCLVWGICSVVVAGFTAIIVANIREFAPFSSQAGRNFSRRIVWQGASMGFFWRSCSAFCKLGSRLRWRYRARSGRRMSLSGINWSNRFPRNRWFAFFRSNCRCDLLSESVS